MRVNIILSLLLFAIPIQANDLSALPDRLFKVMELLNREITFFWVQVYGGRKNIDFLQCDGPTPFNMKFNHYSWEGYKPESMHNKIFPLDPYLPDDKDMKFSSKQGFLDNQTKVNYFCKDLVEQLKNLDEVQLQIWQNWWQTSHELRPGKQVENYANFLSLKCFLLHHGICYPSGQLHPKTCAKL